MGNIIRIQHTVTEKALNFMDRAPGLAALIATILIVAALVV